MANFFDQLDAPGTDTAPPPNFFDQLDNAPNKAPLRISIGPKPLEANGGELSGSSDRKEKVGAGDAFVSNLKQGLSANFSDELAGVNAAAGLPEVVGQTVGSAATLPVGLAKLAYEHLTGQPGEATKAFNDTVAQVRQHLEESQKQQPVASAIGNVGGMLATGLLPIGAASQGASLAARAGAGALAGAGYGALYGAGEGQGLEDRVQRALTGGATGGIVGAAAPPLLSGIPNAAKYVSNKVGALFGHPLQAIQSARDIDKAATERVAGLLKYDAEKTPGGMGPADLAAAQASGQNPITMDFGNAATQDAARAAANSSPAGRAALEAATKGRFEEQSQRVSDFIRQLVPTGGNAARTQEALDAAQRAANKPAYAKAYAAGDRPIAPPSNIMGAEEVTAAMRTAARQSAGRGAVEGFTGLNATHVTNDGRVVFGKSAPAYPNLQFWDYTNRALKDQADAAFRAGRNNEGSYLSSLSRALRDHLDAEVPEFAQARAGAAKFFGAENALEAGQKFVTMRGSLEEARQAINKMSAPERALFAEGFASDLADKVSKIANNRNVTIDRIFNSPDGKARINMALGPGRAGELEMFLRREDMMDLARKAISGNSTTVRQLMMKALANAGSHGAVGAGIGASIDEILNGELNWKHVLMGGILAGTGVATTAVNAKLAQSVAEKLASDDPKIWREVLKVAANNPQVANTVKRGEAFLEKLIGSTSGNHPIMLPPTGAIPAAAEQQQQQ